ncbi:hypothetical protein Mapa_004983 [Marchantia paleacea]|nr:hypothetical protein Mapa_004983 [Marchantia paleacea]
MVNHPFFCLFCHPRPATIAPVIITSRYPRNAEDSKQMHSPYLLLTYKELADTTLRGAKVTRS